MSLKNKIMSVLVLFIMAFAFSCSAGEDDASSPVSNVSFYVDADKNYNFRIGSYLSIEIAQGSFHLGTNFEAMNGVYLDNLGVSSEGVPNDVTFENSPEVILQMYDIVELIFDKNFLVGSIKITFDYGGEITRLINAMNSGMQNMYPGIYKVTHNDIGVYYFDKNKGEFVICTTVIDTVSKKFVLNTQLPGVYVFSLKPEVYGIWGEYFLNHPELLEP